MNFSYFLILPCLPFATLSWWDVGQICNIESKTIENSMNERLTQRTFAVNSGKFLKNREIYTKNGFPNSFL